MNEVVSIFEYDRVRAGDSVRQEGRLTTIAVAHYEALYRFDTRPGATPIFEWGRDSARAGEFVGVIQLPGLSIEILPKIHRNSSQEVGRSNLIQMLSIADDFDDVREQDVASQQVADLPLAEWYYELFANRLHREFRRGVLSAYVAQRENQMYLRGRLVFAEHVKQNVVRKDRFFVEHDEFLPDTLLNRIFKATCRTVLRSVSSARARDKLTHCLAMLERVREVELRPHDFDRLHLDRQSRRFEMLLRFCEMVLRSQTPTASAGKDRAFSVTFNMWALYESYITSMLARYVLPRDWKLHPKASGHGRALLYEGRRGVLGLEPDLYLQRGSGETPADRTVIDTKWKSLDADAEKVMRASRNDLYQLFAYAHRFGAQRNILLYPSTNPDELKGHESVGPPGDEASVVRRVYRVPDTDGQTIESVVVTLPSDLRREHRVLIDRLAAALELDPLSHVSSYSSSHL